MPTTTTSLRYIPLSDFASPMHHLIAKATHDQEWTDRKIQAIRLAVASGEPYTNSMRSDVATYSRIHDKAVWLEATCKRIIEKRANEQGMTTVLSSSQQI